MQKITNQSSAIILKKILTADEKQWTLLNSEIKCVHLAVVVLIKKSI